MTTIRSTINDLIQSYSELGVVVTPARIEADVKDLHADVFGDYAIELAAKGVRQMARELLTASARSKQQAFEGMDLPTWFTRHDAEGGYSYVPLKVATLLDHEGDVEVKRINAEAALGELQVAIARNDLLRSVDGASDDMLVLHAASLLAVAS